MRKKCAALLAAVLVFAAFTGCNKRRNTPDDLEIVAWDAGYGVQWLNDIADAFAAEAWVKEKYPNLTVSVTSTKLGNAAETKIPSGARNNTVDLFLSPGQYQLMEPDMNGNDQLADLTEGVYNQPVPGEDVLYKDKILTSYLKSMQSADKNSASAGKYFATPWAGGIDGILYNADILGDLGLQVPLTTDQLIAACAAVKGLEGNQQGKYALGYSFITSHEADYSNYVFPIWWSQYQTVAGFENFYQGIDGNKISRGIFNQRGRLHAAKVMEDIFRAANGYNYEHFKTTEYMVAQTMFLQGKAVFMMNGDWFDNEMRSIAAKIKQEEGLDYKIRIMKTPVISAIVDQTPSIVQYAADHGITADEALALTVRAVDTDAPAPDGVTDADYKRIAAARRIIHTIGPSHTSIIPAYAAAKDVAMDFMRFMATDKANVLYSRATLGAALPFKIDMKTLAPDVYEQSSEFQKSRSDIFGDGEDVDILTIDMAYPLRRFGNVGPFANVNNFADVLGSSGSAKTAQQLFDQTIEYWSVERWNAAKASAGIVG